jgi:hypothetical protein
MATAFLEPFLTLPFQMIESQTGISLTETVIPCLKFTYKSCKALQAQYSARHVDIKDFLVHQLVK